MEVEFSKGLMKDPSGRRIPGWWAVTPFGILAWSGDPKREPEYAQEEILSKSETVTTLDLTGLEKDQLEHIVRSILKGGYLDKPGVKHKGEAVFFILVNEALHELSRLQSELDSD